MTRRQRWAWIEVGLWTALIWTLSSRWFSASETESILYPLLRWLVPGISLHTLVWIHFLVRKAAHAFEYAVLGLLVFRSLRLGTVRSVPASAALSVGFCLVVASLDETRQYLGLYTAMRTGTLHDVVIDLCGASLGVALALTLRALFGGPGAAPPALGATPRTQ
jgi:VanZ family protein